MARTDYLPATDEGLRTWTANFSAIIKVNYAELNLTEVQASTYGDQQTDYEAKLVAAIDPLTRGNRTVFLKDEARTLLVATTRSYARQINNTMSVTDAQRQALGLHIRDTTPSSVGVPGESPVVFAELIRNRRVKLTLRQNSNLRAKPAGVADALIFTHVGPTAPGVGSDQWQYAATISRTTMTLTAPPSETGDTLWISAFWTNAKGQSGPASEPVSVNLPAGGSLPQEQGEVQSPMRVAA